MAETEATIAAYQEAVEIFDSLTAVTPVMWNIQRQRRLADGTVVSIDKHNIQDLTFGGPLLDTLYVNIGICSFGLNRDGLISFNIHPPFIKIGQLDIPAFDHPLNVNWHISNMPTESHAVFREASRPLVSWLKRVIDENHYSTPPVTI